MLESKRYKKILKAQKILKIAKEVNLKNNQIAKDILLDKRQQLFDMQNSESSDETMWIDWIPKAIKHTYSKELFLNEKIEQQKKEVFQKQKRIDISEDKYKQSYAAEQQQKYNLELEEHLNTKSCNTNK